MATTQQWQMDIEGMGKAQERTAGGIFSGRISGVTAIFMILIALLIDGIQAFLIFIIIGLVVNWIISMFAWLFFYIWLKSLGISMAEAKGMRTLLFLGLAFGFEFIPLVNTLPGWTAFVVGAVINEYGSAAVEKVYGVNKLVQKKT